MNRQHRRRCNLERARGALRQRMQSNHRAMEYLQFIAQETPDEDNEKEKQHGKYEQK